MENPLAELLSQPLTLTLTGAQLALIQGHRREVQQFRPDVRNSTEVRFAVQAFAALNSNNFVRFFKLVQKASYLNACLLHCYFSQIRRDALKSLNIAYTVSTQRSTIFPLDNVVRMLLFRDFEDAIDFISYYGLSVSDGFVELNRSAFLEPESLPKPKKSLFVGQKLTVSIGEIVNGGPLKPVTRHVPVCSFNAQNKYIGENTGVDSTTSNQKVSIDVKEPRVEGNSMESEMVRSQPSSLLPPASLPSIAVSTFQPIAQPLPPPPKPQPVYTDVDIAEVVEDLVHDVLKVECGEISSAGAAYIKSAIWISDVTADELMTEVVLGMLRQIASVVFNTERERVEEEKRQAEEERCAVEKDKRARIARCSKEVCAEIMGVFLEDEIFQNAKETLQELQCFCKYLQRWREAVAARKKLKRQMRAFPAAPCCVDPKDKLKALSPSAECPIAREHLAKRIVNLGHAGNLGTSSLRLGWLRNKAIHQMKVQHFYQQLLRILADWLKAKFAIDKNLKETTSVVNSGIETLALHTSLCTRGNQDVHVSVCIKMTHGTLSTSETEDPETQKKLLGTSGLILLLSPQVRSDDVAEEDIYWLSVLLQLKRLLQAKPFRPVVPLVVLVPSHGDEAAEKEVEEGLMLPDLISANLISGYSVVEIPDSVNDLQGTRKWLIAQYPSAGTFCCQTLTQYVEDGLDLLFSQQFYQDRKERHMAGLQSQDPSAIIELYNSAVQFLAEVVSSEDLCELSWPVTEFAEPGGSKLLPHLQWNIPNHLAWLKKAVLSFQIPHMDLPPLGAPWDPVCAMIFQYLSQTASSLQTQEILQSQIENLLSRTYLKWKDKNSVSSRENGPSVEEIPWDSVLALCINHKLRDWKPPCLPIVPEAVNEDGQIYVYFFKDHLRKFTCPFLWEEARLKTQKMIQRRSKVKTTSFAKVYPLSLCPAEYCASKEIARNTELTVPSGADLTMAVSEVDVLPEFLSSKLQEEKAESRRFEDQLQHLLVNDSDIFQDSPSLPLYLPETLVRVPQIIHLPTKMSTSRSPEPGNKELKDPDTSLSHRLKYLKQLIMANREEEMACEFHLSTLLDVMDT
ncbi:hypothetical protein JD844_023369 [Phrynosoma platyrhinos]|uniref:PCI domain-containing protein n=1 Tax=Phrynosoma platyrhinos TaxID=52577 RepID=A0ABQ7SWP3_PHRPL|nr:hypothetical protein JD844_023369 [Phrynosoma platyrhinos]